MLGEGSANPVVIVSEGNGDVHASCSWMNGNPPRTIRLVGPDNAVLNRSGRSGSGQLQASLQGPRCRDSGLYSCQVDGTDQRKTVRLLVKCKWYMCVCGLVYQC